MSLAEGTRLGPYEILGLIGAGGMGEVYKARDTRLDRSVAIKILPPEVSADAERRARFEREARAIAALSHPHICTLYDIGEAAPSSPACPERALNQASRGESRTPLATPKPAGLQPGEGGSPVPLHYLVMEHLAGESLAERLQRGPLPLAQTLDLAAQIAEALDAAHKHGVIHRDLKPGNVMLTTGGTGQSGVTSAKLLDFGLAKLTGHGERPALAGGATAATMTAPITERGTILGTLQYMAPEQLEGKEADARTDLWALGAILYEMVTGRRAFEGDSQVSLIGNIMNAEPAPLAALKPLTPPALERVVKKCLAKRPDDRWDSAHDVADELRWIRETSGAAAVTGVQRPPRQRGWRRWIPIGIAGTVILAALAFWLMSRQPRNDLTAATLTSYSGIETQPSFSPDGSKVTFVWNGDGEDNQDIYVKQVRSAGPPMRLTTAAAAEASPSWSPDDRWIAFTRDQREHGNFAVLLVSPLGGPERKLAEMVGVGGLCWTPDAKWLVFSERDSQETMTIRAVSIETGEKRQVTTFLTTARSVEGGAMGDDFPSISPDGRTLAFVRGGSYVYDLYVMPLTEDLRPAGEPRRVTEQHYPRTWGVAWTASGREIVYAAGGVNVQSLWRVSASGRQKPGRLPYAAPEASFPAVAPRASRLAYTWRLRNVNLWRLDARTGERRMLIGSTYDSRIPQYSPDGRKIAFQSNRSGNIEVWTCDADGSNCQQLTSFGGPQCGTPRWSPDGRWIALDARVEGRSEIFVIAADGGTPRRVTNGTGFNNSRPSWSADGGWLFFGSDRSGRREIWKAPAGGGQPTQFTRTGGAAALSSPDGRHIYYVKEPGPPGLFRMPAEGGEEQQVVAQAPGNWASFGVTAKGVYFRTEQGLQFLDPATGKLSTVAVVPITYGLCVSPDDRYVVWAQTDRDTSDLMLVEDFR